MEPDDPPIIQFTPQNVDSPSIIRKRVSGFFIHSATHEPFYDAHIPDINTDEADPCSYQDSTSPIYISLFTSFDPSLYPIVTCINAVGNSVTIPLKDVWMCGSISSSIIAVVERDPLPIKFILLVEDHIKDHSVAIYYHDRLS